MTLLFSGARLKEARVDAGMTQEAAARAIGVTVSTYCKWEYSAQVPSGNHIPAIINTFSVPRLLALYATVDGREAG